MRLQLVTIGILALLLCAVVPMSVGADPVKAPSPTIEGKLYAAARDSSGLFIPGKSIGKIVVDKESHIWTITTHTNVKFTPGIHDLRVTKTGPTASQVLIIGEVYADANGNIIDTSGSVFLSWTIADIEIALDNGGWFMVY